MVNALSLHPHPLVPLNNALHTQLLLLGPLVLDDEDEEGDELTLQTPSQDQPISPTAAARINTQHYPTTFTTTTT